MPRPGALERDTVLFLQKKHRTRIGAIQHVINVTTLDQAGASWHGVRLFDRAERLETIQAVKEGLALANGGEDRPMDDVFDARENDLRRAKAQP